MIELAALMIGVLSQAPPTPVPQAAFVILVPEVDGTEGTADPLIASTERLLVALDDDRRIAYRRSVIRRETLGAVLSD